MLRVTKTGYPLRWGRNAPLGRTTVPETHRDRSAGRSCARWRRMQLLQGSRRVGGELVAGASEHVLKRQVRSKRDWAEPDCDGKAGCSGITVVAPTDPPDGQHAESVPY